MFALFAPNDVQPGRVSTRSCYLYSLRLKHCIDPSDVPMTIDMAAPSQPFPPGGDRCLQLAKPDYVNFVFSILILVGILISYLPQHLRIINRKSSFGLSPYFVLLGTTSGTCQFANILTLPGSRDDMACCREVNGFACFAGLLGVMQVGMQWTCFAVMSVLYQSAIVPC